MLGTLMSGTSGWSGTFLHGTEEGSELLECEKLWLTWIPVNAPSLDLFMAAYSSSRTIHQSLMRLVCGVGFSRVTVATFNASVWRSPRSSIQRLDSNHLSVARQGRESPMDGRCQIL